MFSGTDYRRGPRIAQQNSPEDSAQILTLHTGYAAYFLFRLTASGLKTTNVNHTHKEASLDLKVTAEFSC